MIYGLHEILAVQPQLLEHHCTTGLFSQDRPSNQWIGARHTFLTLAAKIAMRVLNLHLPLPGINPSTKPHAIFMTMSCRGGELLQQHW